MISARPERLALALLLASPALAARPRPPALPPLLLDAAAPLIEVEVAGQRLRLTVDIGGDDIVQLNPDSPARAVLAAASRPDGKPVDRGLYRVAVGQTALAIPFSRETLIIAGQPVRARVLQPAATPVGQGAGSDGVIGLPLLPHPGLEWHWRPATPADRAISVPARIGRSDAWGLDWAVKHGGRLDVELHPLRTSSVVSAAAASSLAAAGGGQLIGPVRRVPISFGAVRPVRQLALARPVVIAGLRLDQAQVRLFDWAGRTSLPPDADPAAELTVTGTRGRQDQWANAKLGRDVLAACASLRWSREPAQFTLVCPATD
ncbi:MAG: hypothetical protein KGQ52_00075 [Alphaproteobacteria bacterium]|nr:hypothetical protein [Alphaproteobacteria bacterium]